MDFQKCRVLNVHIFYFFMMVGGNGKNGNDRCAEPMYFQISCNGRRGKPIATTDVLVWKVFFSSFMKSVTVTIDVPKDRRRQEFLKKCRRTHCTYMYICKFSFLFFNFFFLSIYFYLSLAFTHYFSLHTVIYIFKFFASRKFLLVQN